MLDCVVRNEKEPDVVQISGGEPTLHPDFFRVLEMCKERPIRHLMVNTNGIRIAQDEEFAKRLAEFMPQFEVYLQFDSLQREPLMQLRGADLRGDSREGAGAAEQAGNFDDAGGDGGARRERRRAGRDCGFRAEAAGGARSDVSTGAAGRARAGLRLRAAPADADRSAAAHSRTDRASSGRKI